MLSEEVSVICSEWVISVLWQPPRSWAGSGPGTVPGSPARSPSPSMTWEGEAGRPLAGV